MSIALCNKCFPIRNYDGEVLTCPPIAPCQECGAWDGHDYRIVRNFRTDPREQKEPAA